MTRIIKGVLYSLIFCAFLATRLPAQSTYKANSCSESNVSAAIAAEQASPVDGDIISIPSGTCTWTGSTNIQVSFNNSVTIQGAGAVSSLSGGTGTTGTDQTVIIDNLTYSGFSSAIAIHTAAGKSFRWTGIALEENSSSSVAYNGILNISGASSAVRIDHNHIVMALQTLGIYIGGTVLGVADHNYFQATSGLLTFDFEIQNGQTWNGDSGGYGDASWADADYFGSSKFFFIEDTLFSNGDVMDSHDGARYVLRYSSISSAGNNGQLFNHGLGGDRGRSTRASEVYQNTFTQSAIQGGDADGYLGGTLLFWGNTTVSYNCAVGFPLIRASNATYVQSAPPAEWGYCGGAPYATGSASIAANSTALTGSGFSTAWPSGSMIILAGASCTVNSYTSSTCQISSVNSSTSITLSSPSTVAVTNGAYTEGSPWDGKSQANGYPCMDGPGRGTGQMVSGEFPNVLNSSTGTAAWPNQALDPAYIWDNNYGGSGYGDRALVCPVPGITDNVDFYQQFGTYAEPGTWNGTKGVGQGLYSAIPSTCTAGPGGNTPGVGYWATDQNTLYVCNPTNTWTAYYAPYTYPHPLTQTGTVPVPPTNVQAVGH